MYFLVNFKCLFESVISYIALNVEYCMACYVLFCYFLYANFNITTYENFYYEKQYGIVGHMYDIL